MPPIVTQQKLAYVPSTSLQYDFKEVLTATGQIPLSIKALPKEFFKRQVYIGACTAVAAPATYQLKGRVRLYCGGQIFLEIPFAAAPGAALVAQFGWGGTAIDTTGGPDFALVRSSGGSYANAYPIFVEGAYDAADFIVDFHVSGGSATAMLLAVKSMQPFPA